MLLPLLRYKAVNTPSSRAHLLLLLGLHRHGVLGGLSGGGSALLRLLLALSGLAAGGQGTQSTHQHNFGVEVKGSRLTG